MTFSEMKSYLRKVVQGCMGGPVRWAEQYQTQPAPPYTTMKLKDTGIPAHPINIVKDGELYSYYGCEKILEVNRYTAGAAAGAGEVTGVENTAVEELTGLLLFLQSDKGIEMMYLKNISMVQMGSVRDLTALEGTRYKNRAMLEMKVCCTLEYYNGKALVFAPKASIEAAEGPTGYFEDVEMEDKYE